MEALRRHKRLYLRLGQDVHALSVCTPGTMLTCIEAH